ncbi:DDE-type integrase/transposase/recombinase [Corynebacterium timonense]|uniref:DDE-type integrase/transposase/recombinase n=1 Tax=Corynebacterium timonense TaxID=441500 RepID=UPI000A435473
MHTPGLNHLDLFATDNYSCHGARTLWAEVNRRGEFGRLARCTVERLVALDNIRGIRRRRKRPSTRSAAPDNCPVDLVERDFCVDAPNRLWVADITYIPTRVGWVYASFVLDAYTREIVGWQITNHMRTSLAKDALDMALSARLRAGEDVSGLVHHFRQGRAVQVGRLWRDLGQVAGYRFGWLAGRLLRQRDGRSAELSVQS